MSAHITEIKPDMDKQPKWASDADDYIEKHLPKWVGVRERLPDKKCIATYKNSHGKRRTVIAHYVPRFTWEATGEEDENDEYSEKLDRCFLMEGWYECQENWGDFAMIYVNEGDVTHWMKLPPAPEVEEELKRLLDAEC